MSHQIIKESPSLKPLSGQTRKLVILLHGYGADGKDLMNLGYEWQASLPDTEFIAPNAPFLCEQSSFGYQWFSLSSWHLDDLETQIAITAPILNQFLDETLIERGLTDDDLALVGFSQGAMLALYTALKRTSSCACVIGYSGALIDRKQVSLNKVPAILLVHGDHDEVVPYIAMQQAQDHLKEVGITSQAYTCAFLGHGINQEGIELGRKFLREHLYSEIESKPNSQKSIL